MEPPDYTPSEYWDERLSRDYSLRGTGHISYSDAYNRWLYRRKGDVLDRALELAPGSGKALDVGSGTGWVVERLSRRGYEVRGCDVSPLAVKRLGESFGAERFSRAAIGSDPLPAATGSCDVVTAMDVLYHVTDDALWRAALAEISRVLSPSGTAVVTDSLGEAASPASHVRFRGGRQWREALESSGLGIVAVLPLYSWLSRDRDAGPLGKLPDRARGPLEYSLERLAPRSPHLRCAVIGPTTGPAR